MKPIYFDNAATTSLDPEVLEEMLPFLSNHFGNPSSTHAFGRKAKTAVETSRKKIASLLGCAPNEIFFTSGGTEADNLALNFTSKIETFITSPLEHHAVLHALKNKKKTSVKYIKHHSSGEVDYESLKTLLTENPHALVSIMHANNEVGTINNLEKISRLCKENGALFHSDTVQTIAHLPFDFSKEDVPDYIVASSHKFHGPKGIGFLVAHGPKPSSMILGGNQEREMRGGTENVAGIVGMAKALEKALTLQTEREEKLLTLKLDLIRQLKKEITLLSFNGGSDDTEKGLHNILNFSIEKPALSDTLLFSLDLKNIAISGGSACLSGALKGSHVLNHLRGERDTSPSIRVSLSHLNTKSEIDFFVSTLKEITN